MLDKMITFAETQPPSRGSARTFVRLNLGGKEKAILMIERNYSDFKSYLNIAESFRRAKVPVPDIFDSLELEDKFLVLMEDCGEKSLYDLYWSLGFEKVKGFYWQAFDVLQRIWEAKPLSSIPDFHPKVIKWEVDYFVSNVLERFLGISSWFVGYLREISHSFYNLILERKTLIHRDFQSQNLLIKDNKVRVIDFQSAHWSSPLYDLASLLEDPYVNLPQRFKNEIKSAFLKRFGFSSEGYDIAAFHRLMQASGAYVKLALTDGKLQFFRYLSRSLPRLILLSYRWGSLLNPLRKALKRYERVIYGA